MPRPNILLLFTDQQRADTIHAGGNSVIKTPSLDRLAREGVLFDSAYTPSPVCVPARCSLIYGQYPHNTGCADNPDPMPDDRPSMMDLLSGAGYRTHGVGKMHFRPDSQALRGFQTRERQEEGVARVADDDYLSFLQANGFGHVYDPMGQRSEMYYIPQPAQMPARLHATNWVAERSLAFLRERDRSQPFFLFTSFIHPHPPFSPPTPWNKLYRAPLMPLPKEPQQCEALHTYTNRHQNRYKFRDNGIDYNLLRAMKAYYYACISFIDYQVSRLLGELEEQGILDDTLILFTSDHGEFLGDYRCFGKRSMLDAAARIPLLARYPARFAQGALCDAPVSLVDVMPTVLQAAGVGADAYRSDGADLAALADAPPDDRTVYSQFQNDAQGLYMALNRRHKYVYSAPDRREFFFDRQQDPDETRNRAGIAFCRGDMEACKAELFGRYRRDGFQAPLDGDEWRLYPQPTVPDDPDAGLLIQDHAWSRPYLHIDGYSD